jgi:hypothetical protein
MFNDRPQVITKPISKESLTESLFLEKFNAKYSKTHKLVRCHQDFNTFDYWLIDLLKPNSIPKLVELKHHTQRDLKNTKFIGCDLIKLQKLKAQSQDTKAYVFHLLEDVTLIQDATTPIDQIKEITYKGQQVLLGLIMVQKCIKTIDFGFQNLQKLRDHLPVDALLQRSLGATAQGSQAHSSLDDIL